MDWLPFDVEDWMNFLIIAVVVLGAIAKKLIAFFSSKSLRQSPIERSVEEARAQEAKEGEASARPVARPLPPAVLRRDANAERPVAKPLPPVAETSTNLPEIIFEMLGVPVPEAMKREPAGPRKVPPRPVRAPRTPVGPAGQPKHAASRPVEAAQPRQRPRTVVAEPTESKEPARDTRAGLLEKQALVEPVDPTSAPVDVHDLFSPKSLRHAVLLSEILGPPLSLRGGDRVA